MSDGFRLSMTVTGPLATAGWNGRSDVPTVTVVNHLRPPRGGPTVPSIVSAAKAPDVCDQSTAAVTWLRSDRPYLKPMPAFSAAASGNSSTRPGATLDESRRTRL